MRMFSFDHDPPVKTGCCNEEVSTTYWLAKSLEEAKKQLKIVRDYDGVMPHGLCASCMANHLVSSSYEIE